MKGERSARLFLLFLFPVHVLIGLGEAFFERVLPAVQRGYAERDAKLPAPDAELRGGLFHLRDVIRGLLCGRGGKQQEKLVAAHAEHDAVGREHVPEKLRRHPEIFVARHMPVGVIDFFQIVAVGGDEADGINIFFRQLPHVLVEIGAVVQTGQLVGRGLPVKFPLQHLVLGNIVDKTDDAVDVSGVVENRFLDDIVEFLQPIRVDLDRVGGAAPGLHDFLRRISCLFLK